LNAFPTKAGVSAILSTHKIVYRRKLDFEKYCKVQFGTYCKAHDEPVPMNTMITFSTPAPAIFLGSMGNLQVTYNFFNLTAGKKFKQQKMMVHPMPDPIINKIKQFGKINASPNAFDFVDRK
jgi:hypothetical protein